MIDNRKMEIYYIMVMDQAFRIEAKSDYLATKIADEFLPNWTEVLTEEQYFNQLEI